jgi:integrative and conjugative element protein (TIGR02256 family)
MAEWCDLAVFRRLRNQGWRATFPGGAQHLSIEAKVLRHARKYRQSRMSSLEAGGQLFGTVTRELVAVSAIAGPHRLDERSRFGFRSHSGEAQRTIERFARQGLLYLGEWHTHAEQRPQPSRSDYEAMRSIAAESRLNAATILLIIIGLAASDADLGVWYLDSSGELLPVIAESS